MSKKDVQWGNRRKHGNIVEFPQKRNGFKLRRLSTGTKLYIGAAIILIAVCCIFSFDTLKIEAENFIGNILIWAFIGFVFFIGKKEIQDARRIEELANQSIELTPKQFLALENNTKRGKLKGYEPSSFAGIYILYNETKDMYYVGQAKDVVGRVKQHFSGHGNGDVYADYKYGDIFRIRTVKLEGSGFQSLNALERKAISKYNAYSSGYNKTRGNRN